MDATLLKIPDSLGEDDLVRLPATWDDYLNVLEEADQSAPTLTIQYLIDAIIMSQASRQHESLVGVLIWLLNNYFINQPDYDVLGSSIKIMIPGRQGDFNADVTVVREPVEYGITRAEQADPKRIANPYLIVEVLSKSTARFDLNEKLDYYKLIPSLQYMLFVDQNRPWATTYTRTGAPDEWLNHDYRTLEAVVRLGDLHLPMQEIYRKVSFDPMPGAPAN